MAQFNLQEVFLIDCFNATFWTKSKKNENYFQIIFIEKGQGKHIINDTQIPYKAGNVFLIGTEDRHEFDIKQETTFCIFSFTRLLFSSRVNLPDRQYWLRRIDGLLRHPNLKPGDVIHNDSDRELIWHIHDLIQKEIENREEYYRHIISNMVSTTLSIISRNISQENKHFRKRKEDKYEQIDDILAYIHSNVYEPNRVKIASLAGNFNMTGSTFSNYFKKKTGKSVHNYIINYKLDLVKHRLKHTDFTVSQIAHQLAFTDESHLTRIFKKYLDTTPKKYKEETQ